MTEFFTKGKRVEVTRCVAGTVKYYAATVVHEPAMNSKSVFVEYEALTIGNSVRMREIVETCQLRPPPPDDRPSCFKVDDVVDAFCDGYGCWIKGRLRYIVENSKCGVRFDGDGFVDFRAIEVDQFNLRIHRDWNDGSWIPLIHEQDCSSELVVMPRKLTLKLTWNKIKPPENFEKGAAVEVTSNEDGYKGSWYSASIFNPLGNNKYIVEFLTLRRDDDERLPLREITEAQHIRPFPPQLPPIPEFKPLDKVDAWYNEGWWTGAVSQVLYGSKYVVYFSPTNEELEFSHSDLRLHQDWMNGKWVFPSKEEQRVILRAHGHKEQARKKRKIEVKPKTAFKKRMKVDPSSFKETEAKPKPVFKDGMKVEVRSDEQGYEDSWFTAVIKKQTTDDNYLVEYQTLVTDDESELLTWEAKCSDIRPVPPPIQRVYPYDPLDHVDAWYNEGWWSGQINTVYADMSYDVYFEPTYEVLKFVHVDLRPRQEWKNGEWVPYSKGRRF